MNKQFETIQNFSKDSLEATTTSLKVVSEGAQSIVAETTQYAKKSFEQGTSALEKVLGAKTLNNAIQIQTDYAKAAYEGFVAQATKVRGLYVNVAQDALKPHGNLIAKVASSRKASASKTPAA